MAVSTQPVKVPSRPASQAWTWRPKTLIQEMGLVMPLPHQSHSLGAVPSCSPLPTGAGPALILEQRKEAVISAPRSFLFSKRPSQLLFSKCTLSAAGAGREGSGLSLPVSGCFMGPVITAGSQRPRVLTDGAENLVMTPLSPRPSLSQALLPSSVACVLTSLQSLFLCV